jgi:hypothetical protein
VTNTGTLTADASCTGGDDAAGGGASADTGNVTSEVPLVGAAPATVGQTPDGWRATVGAGDVTVYVICVP